MRLVGPIPTHILKLMPKDDRIPLGKAGLTLEEASDKEGAKLERELHEQIESWLRTQGIVAGHARMDRKSTFTEGWPDFTFAVLGRAVAVEVKLPGKGPTDEQIRCMTRMAANGWTVRIAYSLADVVKLVESIRA